MTVADEGHLTIGNGSVDSGVNYGGVVIQGGKIVLTGREDGYTEAGAIDKANTNLGGYDQFDMSGGSLELNDARIWIGAVDDDDPASYHDMNLTGSTIVMNNGGITGVSGTVGDGENELAIGNKINLAGSEIQVSSGNKNVINALEVAMTGGLITADKGATLQLSTYMKDGTAWANKYQSKTAGAINVSGGSIDVAGKMLFTHLVLDGQASMEVTGSANGDFGTVGYGKDGSSLTVKGGNLTIGQGEADAGVNVGGVNIQGGKIVLTGREDGYTEAGKIYKANTNLGGYDQFDMSGDCLELNDARIWIGAVDDDDPASYHAMNLTGGTIVMNNGGITGVSGTVGEQEIGNAIKLGEVKSSLPVERRI